jgi:hypothetical protein
MFCLNCYNFKNKLKSYYYLKIIMIKNENNFTEHRLKGHQVLSKRVRFRPGNKNSNNLV